MESNSLHLTNSFYWNQTINSMTDFLNSWNVKKDRGTVKHSALSCIDHSSKILSCDISTKPTNEVIIEKIIDKSRAFHVSMECLKSKIDNDDLTYNQLISITHEFISLCKIKNIFCLTLGQMIDQNQRPFQQISQELSSWIDNDFIEIVTKISDSLVRKFDKESDHLVNLPMSDGVHIPDFNGFLRNLHLLVEEINTNYDEFIVALKNRGEEDDFYQEIFQKIDSKCQSIVNKIDVVNICINKWKKATEECLQFVDIQKWDKKWKYLEQVFDIIEPNNILALKNDIYNDEEEKFFKTIIKIGKIFKTRMKEVNQLPRYFSGEDSKYPFVIYKNQIVIMKDLIKQGTYKKVFSAFRLNDLKPFVHHHVTSQLNVKLTLKEVELTAKFAKDNLFCVQPYEWMSVTKTLDQLDMLQFRYDEDAKVLGDDRPYQQLHAFKGMAHGLAILHKQGYIHCDVKPDNIFLIGNDAKVGDFGLTSLKSEPKYQGSLGFYAPEYLNVGLEESQKQRAALLKNVFTPKIDSFALGVTMFQILNRSIDNFPLVEDLPEGLVQFASYISEYQKYEVPFGLLNQNYINEFIDLLKNNIKNDNHLIPQEKKIKIQMANVCAALLVTDPKRRATCLEAAMILDKIV